MKPSPLHAIGCLLLLGISYRAPRAAEATPAKPVITVPWTLPVLLERVPPLKHDNTGRWPMICIGAFKQTPDDRSWDDGKPLPPEMFKELLKRGLTQWIPPREKWIPYALALQQAGSPVIMMEGQAFNGPAGEEKDGLHELPADYKRDPDQPPQQPKYPCPLLLEGWRKQGDALRATFKKFKDAGVTVDAAWLDWEIEPYPGRSQWNEARACARCRKLFPPGVLDDFERYRGFIIRWHNNLFSTYVVAPILETYPKCSVTNWEEVMSSTEIPTPRWSGATHVPPNSLGMFTAANPVAYGNTAWYERNWKEEWKWPLDVAHMDRVYTQVMLGEISGHEANAMRNAPEKQSIPWVDRYCADDTDPKIPILSRPRYREILRHCWLRGADGMQIFNPVWFPDSPEKMAIVTEEVEDAVTIYDEMLAYRKLLDNGVVMNAASPKATDDGPIWSGLRAGDDAVVRTFTQAGHTMKVFLKPFGEMAEEVMLECPPQGATYVLKRDGGKVQVTRAAP